MKQEELKKIIQGEANQCVKCGLCLPHCPTYLHTLNEGHSPRGRIALLNGLAKNTLELTASTQNYLDHCLTCRACEAVCPSKVAYGQLIDQGRSLISTDKNRKKANLLIKSLFFTLAHKKLLFFAQRFIRAYQKSKLDIILKKTHFLEYVGLKRAADYLPPLLPLEQFKNYYPPKGQLRENLALFTGCITHILDQKTLQDTIYVLNHLGFGVWVPASQGCCGALHLHAGRTSDAWKLAKANLDAFRDLNIKQVISTATGCTAVLQEYALKFQDNPLYQQQLTTLSKKIIDVNAFLFSSERIKEISFSPMQKNIALHAPCSYRNVLKQENTAFALLSKIPNLTIYPLKKGVTCCGAAGLYMLEHPSTADALVADLVDEIIELNPDYVVTTNIGCALHLTKSLKNKGFTGEVIHPMRLIAESIKTLDCRGLQKTQTSQ